MASVFNITTPNDAVSLDSQGHAAVPFTVTNRSGRPLRGRGSLIPLEGTKELWLSIDGETERDFTADGTQQYTVKMALPTGTPAGRYPFRLDVISVANPDEDFTEGPVVAASGTPTAAKPFPWWIVILLIALVVVGGGLIAMLARKPQKVAVPNVIGKTQADAQTLLTQNKLTVGAVTTQASPDQSPDTVLDQNPKENAEVDANSPVALVVATAPKKVSVPNVVSLPFEEANQQLVALGLQVQQTGPVDVEGFTKGQVTSQTPPYDPAQLVDPGSTVQLAVEGDFVNVPSDLVHKRYSDAVAELSALGLRTTYTIEHRGPNPFFFGIVLSTSPGGNTRVLVGSTVTLTIWGQ